MKVAVSILSRKDDVSECLKQINETDADYLHLDVMDGKFVKEKTHTFEEFTYLLEENRKPLDIHLMVVDVAKSLREFASFHPKMITFHVEAVSDPRIHIDYLHAHHIQAGLSIKPSTPVSTLYPYLKEIDHVLVMGVEPGLGGQSFLPLTADKIVELKQIREENQYTYTIEVDGGINQNTIFLVKDADIVVAGSYIINGEKYQEKIDHLR